MDIMRAFRIVLLVLLVPLLAECAAAQLEQSPYNPAERPNSAKQRNGLLDFALHRINPEDIDFGKRLSEERATVLDETVRNGYFWSNVVAISLLGCLFIVIAYQHQVQVRRDGSTAEVLAGYEHALSRAVEQAEDATRKNTSLREALTAVMESTKHPPAKAVDSPERRPLATDRPAPPQQVDREPVGNGTAKPNRDRPAVAASATAVKMQLRLFAPDADLITRINLLEQQLTQSREDNKELRRRISDGDRRLESEHAKNRQLKGA